MRGKKEDRRLRDYYNQMISTGTYWVESERFKNYLKDFRFIPKKANFVGLQVADLVAYPVTRHILEPDVYNPAFEIIAKNIYHEGDKLTGMVVFPKAL